MNMFFCVMRVLKFVLVFIILFPSEITFVVTSPDNFRPGIPETIRNNIINQSKPVESQVYLQDFIQNRNLTSTNIILKDDSPVTWLSDDAFVQTDKPIYLPEQEVHIRIIRLHKSHIHTDEPFILHLRNPLGNIKSKHCTLDSGGITDTTFQLPKIPVYGNWSVSIRYGYEMSSKSTVHFQVQEYELPSFSVRIEGPRTIRKTTNKILIGIGARYVSGRPVVGYANVAHKIRFPNGTIASLVSYNYKKLFQGLVSIEIPFKELSKKNLGFPEILGSALITEATIVDIANGKSETAQDDTTIFTTSPFKISVVESPKGFKPGAPYEIKAKISYQDHRELEENVWVEISEAKAMKSNGEFRNVIIRPRSQQRVDTFHRVFFSTDTLQDDQELHFKLKTNAYYLSDDEQATAILTVHIDLSRASNHFMRLSSPQGGTNIEIGSQFSTSVTVHPHQPFKVYYKVTSRGRLLLMNETTVDRAGTQIIQFQVTKDMTPSFRLFVVALIGNETISESLQITVGKTCKYSNGKEFRLELHPFVDEYVPKQKITLTVHGDKETRIGLLAVDEALHIQNKQNLLSQEKVAEMLVDLTRKAETNSHEKNVINDDCRPSNNAFQAHSHSNITSYEIRHFFPTTWFIGNYEIGDKNCGNDVEKSVCEIELIAPDSITTWMIQGVAVSQQTGICVAEPLHVKVFRSMFVELNLPKTAVKGEQIQIGATVYNYENYDIKVTLSVSGVKDLCLGVDPRENNKHIEIKSESAGSVYFPILPLNEGEFTLQVKANSSNKTDTVQKVLKVLPDGDLVTKTLSFELNISTTNIKARNEDDSITVWYDGKQQDEQKIEIGLHLPKDFVPGAGKCIVSAKGSLMGQVVNTFISGLEDKFLRLPHRSGEETMINLAPLVYTMAYLKSLNLLSEKTKAKGLEYIEKGYIQQLNFRNNDGSFSGELGGPSSIWLTAFVIKVFTQSNAFMKINQHYVCDAISWLINKQNSSGEFKEDHFVDKNMTGGIEKASNDTAFLGQVLTAYVAISMSEAKICNFSEKNKAVNKAIKFLNRNISVHRPYTIALVTYASSLNNVFKANKILRSNEVKNKNSTTRHWNFKISESDTLPEIYQSNPTAAKVETTSYALLTNLLDKSKSLKYSHPIVNWLIQKSSFFLTQDTVMVLQALAEYNRRARLPTNIDCIITSDDKEKKQRLETATILHEVEVPANGKLYVDVSGVDHELINVTLRYYEKYCKFDLLVRPEVIKSLPSKMDVNWEESYGLSHGLSHNYSAEEQVLVKVHICTRYLENKFSGLTILDIEMLMGYSPDISDLENLQRNTSNKISHFKIHERSLKLHLNQISNNETCITIITKKKLHVENVQSALVKIYENNKTASACSKYYRTGEPIQVLKHLREYIQSKAPDVWNGTVISREERGNYVVYKYHIHEVMKGGDQSRDEIMKAAIDLEISKTCDCPKMQNREVYIVMGNSFPIRHENGIFGFKYKLDREVFVHHSKPFSKLLSKEEQQFQIDIDDISRWLAVNTYDGCENKSLYISKNG